MLNFLSFFVLCNAVKTDTKLALHHMGKIFIIELIKIKFKIFQNNPLFWKNWINYKIKKKKKNLEG